MKQENLKIFSRPQNDGTEKLEFDSTKRKKYKPGSTASKILVLINYKRLRQKPEIPRSLARSINGIQSNKGRWSIRANGIDIKTLSRVIINK